MNKNFQSTIAFDYPNYQEYSPVAKLVLKDSSYLSKLELISVILGKKDIKAVGRYWLLAIIVLTILVKYQ